MCLSPKSTTNKGASIYRRSPQWIPLILTHPFSSPLGLPVQTSTLPWIKQGRACLHAILVSFSGSEWKRFPGNLLDIFFLYLFCSSFCPFFFSSDPEQVKSRMSGGDRFDCHYCKDSLLGKKYIIKEDTQYCTKCYDNLFGNCCEGCSLPIGCNFKVTNSEKCCNILDRLLVFLHFFCLCRHHSLNTW